MNYVYVLHTYKGQTFLSTGPLTFATRELAELYCAENPPTHGLRYSVEERIIWHGPYWRNATQD